MRRSFKFLLRPTGKQAAALAACLEDHRQLYNAALEHRRTAYRTCSRCGHCAKDNRLTQAEFRCMACGHTAHADVNAAINILRAGLALRHAAQAA
jgi:transposase